MRQPGTIIIDEWKKGRGPLHGQIYLTDHLPVELAEEYVIALNRHPEDIRSLFAKFVAIMDGARRTLNVRNIATPLQTQQPASQRRPHQW